MSESPAPGGRPAWFHGAKSTPFLDRARECAGRALADALPSDETWALDGFGQAFLGVDVSGVPYGEHPVITNSIQVLWQGGVLGGYWGCSHLWDDFDERDSEALFVREAALSERQAAEVAVEWIRRQLSRPLDHHVWSKGDAVVAERWVLADTGRALGHRGGRWSMRHPPVQVIRMRPIS